MEKEYLVPYLRRDCGTIHCRSYMFPEAAYQLSAVCGLKSEIQFYPHKQCENAKIGDTWSQ